MPAGGGEQVGAAPHVGPALQGIVDPDRQVIAGRGFLARRDDVAPRLWPRDDLAGFPAGTFALLGPREFTDPGAGRRHVEPKRIRRPSISQPLALLRRERSRGPRIERRAIRVARPRTCRLTFR